MAIWNGEKVAKLDTDALIRLRSNAERMAANDVLALCDAELSTRKAKAGKSSGRTVRPDDERNAEVEAAAQLKALANMLLSKYDLSAATAKSQSQGFKGFRVLDLLGKNGSAKVGGLQLNGSLALERYISYRLGEDRVVLAYILLKDRPINEARWLVVGPQHLLPDAALITDQLEPLRDVPNAYVGDWGLVTDEFSVASAIFSKLLDSFAPVKDNKL